MIAILIAIALPAAIWSMFTVFGTALPSQVFEMDWGSKPGTFAAYVQPIYSALFATIFWVGLILGMFIGFTFRQEPAGILVLSAVYALAFNLWTAFCYEGYLHRRYPAIDVPIPHNAGQSNYTRRKYAITLALAYSSVILFVVGLLSAVTMAVSR